MASALARVASASVRSRPPSCSSCSDAHISVSHFLPLPTLFSSTSFSDLLSLLPLPPVTHLLSAHFPLRLPGVTSCYQLLLSGFLPAFHLPSHLILRFKNGGSADTTGLPGNVVNQQCSSGSSVVAACDGAVGRDPGVRPTREPLPLNTVVVHRGCDPTGIAPARRCPRSAV